MVIKSLECPGILKSVISRPGQVMEKNKKSHGNLSYTYVHVIHLRGV